MAITKDKFLELTKRSNLVEADRLAKFLAELKKKVPPEQFEDSDFLADQLITAGLLTRWQCDKLKEGRHKGFTLGKYKLLGHLGTGGMSSVYLAEHILMQRRVAIKVLPPARVDDSSYLARFHLEAQAAAALDHPNIVRAYDIDQDGAHHYLVMEFVDGRDLQHVVKNDGPLDYNLAVNYIAQAAEGLHHAHEAGLIHRDIKPANLLVDFRGTLKVLDMGLAKFESTSEKASLTLAYDENVLGTADYLAPEQALNSHEVDRRADIYSLGCTLYFLLTGHPPFPEGTLPQRLMMHQTKMPPSILVDRPDAPPSLVEICERMMSKTVAARYQTAGEVADVLHEWLAARGAGPPGSGPGDSSGRLAAQRRRQGPPPREKPPGTSDTVSDLDRETIKGSGSGKSADARASESAKHKAKLKVAKPIEEFRDLNFLTDSPPPPTRADSGRLSKPPSGVVNAVATAAASQSGVDSVYPRPHRRADEPPPAVWWFLGGGTVLVVVLVVLYMLFAR